MDAARRLCDEGYALLEAGQPEAALQKLAAALDLAPQDALIRYRLGLVHGDAGRTREAMANYDACLAIEPGNARAHNNRGSCLQLLGRDAEAEAAFRRALELDPGLAAPYLNLGHLLEARDPAAASDLYRRAIAAGLDAGLFAHHLAAVGGQLTSRADPAWVRATFDNFAPGFDRQLAALGYDAPQRLAALVSDAAGGALDILDLGCGTGLVGNALAGRGHRITGIDLSAKMLARAAARDAYAALICDDIHAWLATAPAAAFDVAIAADLFIYIGALESAFAGIARTLRPAGRFAFSIEECADGYELRPSGRYAQSPRYVDRCAAPWFDTVSSQQVVLRMEAGVPLHGRLYHCRRRPAP
ncbi:MAG: methyltransferase domain-containing protein [Burkholderiales bacterium]|nr:methyltransferase domain-containing protein [Burkholderiales bacterium]